MWMTDGLIQKLRHATTHFGIITGYNMSHRLLTRYTRILRYGWQLSLFIIDKTPSDKSDKIGLKQTMCLELKQELNP